LLALIKAVKGDGALCDLEFSLLWWQWPPHLHLVFSLADLDTLAATEVSGVLHHVIKRRALAVDLLVLVLRKPRGLVLLGLVWISPAAFLP
jgi:hypothetical protein